MGKATYGHARPFEPQPKVIFQDLVKFWQYMPKKVGGAGRTAPRPGGADFG